MSYQSQQPINQQYQLIKLAWNNYQSAPETLDEKTLLTLQRQVEAAKQIMEAVLSSQAAKDERVKVQEVDFIFDQLQAQFENKESFNLSLAAQNLSEQSLKQAIYQDLLCEKTMDTQSQSYTKVTEEEALTYYKRNKARFSYPERRQVSHILITINEEFVENKRANALLKINGIRKQLLNNMDKFSELAAKYSECPTSLNKGLVGDVSRGQLYPELDDVLFNMSARSISSVVESEIGFHILFCHQIYLSGETSQAEAIKDICKQLDQHRKKKQEKKWLSSLLTI